MYAVVGCNRCSALWVVEGRPETTGCPQCRKRHRYANLKKFVETDDADRAREARAAMLADRSGTGDADLDFSAMAREAEDAGMSDEAYLDAAGVDADAVADAGERADRSESSRSRREIVLDALRELDRPTGEAVVEYAGEDGVPADYVREALAKLVERGDVTETGGRYRLLE